MLFHGFSWEEQCVPASDHSGLQSCAWLCCGDLHIDSRFLMGLFLQGSTVFARVVIT